MQLYSFHLEIYINKSQIEKIIKISNFFNKIKFGVFYIVVVLPYNIFLQYLTN